MRSEPLDLLSMIFVCGGYDGEHRLSIIEVYDLKKNEWAIFEDKLPIRLSNHACYSMDENKVIIIGGG
jgi:N-acetylneuraminic acid mutarotase